MKQVKTFLPIFRGFYNSYADHLFEMEINYLIEFKQFDSYDDIDFDIKPFYDDIAEQLTEKICVVLLDMGFISDYKFENVYSPKFYNFTNDSINIELSISAKNKKAINKYLNVWHQEFEEYLKDRYTSRSGFISFYPNNANEFMKDKPLEDDHKLGAILDFILLHEGIDECDMYEGVHSELPVKNYPDQ